MANSLLIIFCSSLFHHSLYQVLKRGLVRKVFEPIVRRRVGEKATFPDGDVAHLAMLLVSLTNGAVGSVCAVVITWQARDDCIHGRSDLLIPSTHWIAQYMFYDLYAMYDADYLRKDIKRFPQLLTRITVFLKQRWSLVVHHMALLLFGYALIVLPEQTRNYKGDFLAGAFFLRELWNPLQNLAQVLKLLHLQHTTAYLLNGVALVLMQLAVRVLNWPVVIVIYAAQYHNWDVIKSLYSLYPICIVCTTFWQIMEFYWFWIIVRLVAGFTRNTRNKTD